MEVEDLIQDLVKDNEKVKVMPSPLLRMAAWSLIAVGYFFALTSYFNLRADLDIKLSEGLYLIEIGLALFTVLTAGLASLFLSVPDAYQKGWVRWIPVISTLTLTGLLLYEWIYPHIQDGAFISSTDSTYQCALDMLVFSIFPIIVTVYMTKKAATTHYFWSAAMAATAAVNLSYVCLRLIEPNDLIEHLLFWHYLPMFLMVGFIMIIARKLFSW